MNGKQNFEVVIRYHDVDQLPLATFVDFVHAEVGRLHEHRPAIFGGIELHEVKELLRSEPQEENPNAYAQGGVIRPTNPPR